MKRNIILLIAIALFTQAWDALDDYDGYETFGQCLWLKALGREKDSSESPPFRPPSFMEIEELTNFELVKQLFYKVSLVFFFNT